MKKFNFVYGLFVFLLLSSACTKQPETTGGVMGAPVESSRLSGATLSEIRKPFEWTFTDAEFTLASKKGDLPEKLVNKLLGESVKTQCIKGHCITCRGLIQYPEGQLLYHRKSKKGDHINEEGHDHFASGRDFRPHPCPG